MYTRCIFANIKSLLHFDFPHFLAGNSGLKDETSRETWTRSGSAMFASQHMPADFYSLNAPKFGYRCLYTQSANDFISSTNINASFQTKLFDAEIFICPQSSSAGKIFAFMNGNSESIALSLTSSRSLRFSSSAWSLGSESSFIAPLNSWTHLRLQVSGNTLKLFADGSEILSANVPGGSLPVTAMRIGGAHSFFDEFVFRDKIQTSYMPSEPARGVLDITKMGGFGTGEEGELNADSGDIIINSVFAISKISGINFSISGTFVLANHAVRYFYPGTEICFHYDQIDDQNKNYAGIYAFRRIVTKINDYNFTIDAPLTEEFGASDLPCSHLVAFRVPQFSRVNITGGRLLANDPMCIIRCTGDVTFKNMKTHYRAVDHKITDWDLSHSDLPDRMITSYGNFIIMCGGTLSIDRSSFIGHTWVDNPNLPGMGYNPTYGQCGAAALLISTTALTSSSPRKNSALIMTLCIMAAPLMTAGRDSVTWQVISFELHRNHVGTRYWACCRYIMVHDWRR